MQFKKKAVDTIGAFLGSDSEFEGQLSFQGTIRIDGRYKGTISVDGTLIVGPTGEVNAEISASNMIVSGAITGNLTAEKNIEVHACGKVYGNLTAPTVTIHDGAVFQGHCHTGEKNTPYPKISPRLHAISKEEAPVAAPENDNPATKSA